MLEMRPDCEKCGKDLPADKHGAYICSVECTFCDECVTGPLAGVCPNCGGGFNGRPTRSSKLLEKYPASTARKYGG